MEALLAYSFKLSVCLGFVYLFYYLVLRKLTFYSWNRWFLILGTVFSLAIPLVNILPLLEQQESEKLHLVKTLPTVSNFTSLLMAGSSEANIFREYFFSVLPLVFGLGLLIQGGRLIIQFVSFFRIARYAKKLQDGSIRIYQVDKPIAPFSFGNAIFLNQNLHQPAELPEIIKHELVHVSQKHTLDVMWLELLCLINWFNPFVWLLRQAVRQNLEFIVDQEVLHTPGLDRKYYQYLLLKVNCLPNLKIANQFNVSSLKTRIIMMNRMPSKKRELAKFLLVFPMMALILLACQDNLDVTIRNARLKQDVPPPPPPPVPEVPALPPPPPPVVLPATTDHTLFMERNPQVKLLGWQGEHTVVLFFKSGAREEYNLKNPEQKAAAEKKYGTLPKISLPKEVTQFTPPGIVKN